MIVTVFGSANPLPGDEAYETSRELGRLLAEQGHDVLTGAYCGTMEGTTRGAAEAGGRTLGATCLDIEAYRPAGANEWVQEILPSQTLTERLDLLTRAGDAFIALPGGVGTLVEVSLAYNLIVIGSFPPKPLILIGEGWKQTFTAFFASQAASLTEKVRGVPHFAADPQAAVELLQKLMEE